MKRSLLNFGTLVSLILCGAGTLAWLLTSLGCGYYTVWQGPNRSCVVSVLAGSLSLQVAHVSPDRQRPATFRLQRFGGTDTHTFNPSADTSGWSRIGLISTIQRIPYNDGMTVGPPGTTLTMSIGANCRSFVIPLWLVALLGAIAPLKFTARRMQARTRRLRIERGQCGHCGYDLRGSPSLRCPECGMAADPAETAVALSSPPAARAV
jgi:hypothetical protein